MGFPRLILASGSPRRRELLALITKDFTVEKPDVDEKGLEEKIWADKDLPFEEKIKVLVEVLSLEKAKQLAKNHPEAMVVGADTVVVHEQAVLGKPETKEDAYRMIRSLAGKTHRVLTGVSICYSGKELGLVSETKVRFYPWDEHMEKEVLRYIDEGKPMDKAGGYGIQEKAGLWVDWMEGDYFNVVGLPVAKLNKLMIQMVENK